MDTGRQTDRWRQELSPVFCSGMQSNESYLTDSGGAFRIRKCNFEAAETKEIDRAESSTFPIAVDVRVLGDEGGDGKVRVNEALGAAEASVMACDILRMKNAKRIFEDGAHLISTSTQGTSQALLLCQKYFAQQVKVQRGIYHLEQQEEQLAALGKDQVQSTVVIVSATTSGNVMKVAIPKGMTASDGAKYACKHPNIYKSDCEKLLILKIEAARGTLLLERRRKELQRLGVETPPQSVSRLTSARSILPLANPMTLA